MRMMSGALVVVALTAGCSSSDEATAPNGSRSGSPSQTSPGLESYTDPGDGCAQAISAIAYADDSLRPLGQEPYQEFDDVVRSRLAAVDGTLALEAKDWPDEPVHQQAKLVQPLAQAAAAPLPSPSATETSKRANLLLRYRIEAGKLILVCRDAAPAQPPR